jgi:hypothetical protein
MAVSARALIPADRRALAERRGDTSRMTGTRGVWVGVSMLLAMAFFGSACGSSSTHAGSSGGGFCSFTQQAGSALGQQTPTGTPEQVKALFVKVVAALDHARAIAPSKVKADFTVIDSTYHQLYQALVAANFDYQKLNKAVIANLAGTKVTTAQDHIAQYTRKACHLASTTT